MLTTENGIVGKVCSRCRIWKPLQAFPTDRTHGDSQGGRHCRCRACHREMARLRRQQQRNTSGA